jgi:O-Antigen ligase
VFLSHFAQGNATKAATNGFEFAKVVVYFLLLVGNVTTGPRLRIFVGCLGVCAVLFVVLSVLQYHEIIQLPQPEPDLFAIERAKGAEVNKGPSVKDFDYDAVSGQKVEFRRLRGTGIFADPNDLSLLLTMGVFIALYGFTDGAQGIFRLGWLGPLALFIYALSLTFSRGGIIALLAGCFALFYARYGWRGALLLGGPFVPAAVLFFGGRLGSFSATQGTGQSRVQIWSDGLDQLRSAPLFGVGMNELGDLVGKAAHNPFLNAFAELGLFGGTLFLGAFFFALVSLNHILKHRQYLADPELRRMLPFLLAIVISYIVGILSLSRVETVTTYMLLGLVTAFVNVAMVYAPGFAVRFESKLVQRWALASVGFLMASYTFVRVFRA